MFGYLGLTGEIRHLGVKGTVSIRGKKRIGSLVGQSDGTISACYATTNVIGRATADVAAGGLVGQNRGTISACYATGNAEALAGFKISVGGLVGSNFEGTISACYATGNAKADGVGGWAGGLVGENVEASTISACYATGNASVIGLGSLAGGLVGDNVKRVLVDLTVLNSTISNSYARGSTATAIGTDSWAGGLAGNSTGSITDSYFDSDLSSAMGVGKDPSIVGLNKTTVELQTPTVYDDDATSDNGSSIYEAWNVDVDGVAGVDDPWDFGTSSQYPALKVDLDNNDDATAYEFGIQERDPPTMPAQITDLSAVASNMQVTLSWTIPSDGGDPITQYAIKQATSGADLGAATADIVDVGSIDIINSDASYVVTGLASGTLYYFQIAAINSVGTGNYSATTPEATTPAQITDLSAVASNMQVTLSWTIPSDGGDRSRNMRSNKLHQGLTWVLLRLILWMWVTLTLSTQMPAT